MTWLRDGGQQSTQPSLGPVINQNTVKMKSRVGVHITKTKKRQRDKKGNIKPYALQGR